MKAWTCYRSPHRPGDQGKPDDLPAFCKQLVEEFQRQPGRVRAPRRAAASAATGTWRAMGQCLI
jgi:hypothetical protein